MPGKRADAGKDLEKLMAKDRRLETGDLVKPRRGGHAMTVIDVDASGRAVTTSYTDAHGQRRDDIYAAEELRRVGIARY